MNPHPESSPPSDHEPPCRSRVLLHDTNASARTRLVIPPEFATTDLSLAAFLVTLGHPLLHLGGLAGGRRVFHFPASAQRDAATFLQHAAVPARAFANALRDLKARVQQP